MIKKQREFGGMPDKEMPHKATSSSMPTSPLGFVLALPPHHTHTEASYGHPYTSSADDLETA